MIESSAEPPNYQLAHFHFGHGKKRDVQMGLVNVLHIDSILDFSRALEMLRIYVCVCVCVF